MGRELFFTAYNVLSNTAWKSRNWVGGCFPVEHGAEHFQRYARIKLLQLQCHLPIAPDASINQCVIL
jgi:hypothetical protein